MNPALTVFVSMPGSNYLLLLSKITQLGMVKMYGSYS
jgi:hypothetical protein